MTQSALATKLGVARNTVARWERAELTIARPEYVEWMLGTLPALDGQLQAGASFTTGSAQPRAFTRFVGREQEIREVQALVTRSRLTTLTGAGGVGKTRLAYRVIDGVKPEEVVAAIVVELGSLDRPGLVPQAVAVAVGIGGSQLQSWHDVIARFIGSRPLLLLLDNCEHVILVCAELAADLLGRCAGLRILATSREPLGIPGETIWRVPPLGIPASHTRCTAAQVAGCESVELFSDRARAALPGFEITDENAAAVARVCRRLDGIPLALELAAARISVLPVEQIANRLDDALRLLTSGSRIAPARQQTLRATLEWSYRLLTAQEQKLFRRLSVFSAGWTLDAAEAVCSGQSIEGHEVLGLLAGLMDKSLVISDQSEYERVRYRLLEPIRQFGTELLTYAHETSAVRDRHLARYVHEVERADATPAEWHRWFPWFYEELDNLRSALDWAVQSHSTEAGLRLAAALHPFWVNTLHAGEGQSTLERLLALPDVSAFPALKAKCLISRSSLIQRHSATDLGLARSIGDEGIALAREVGDPQILHLGLRLVASMVALQSEPDLAVQMLEESIRLALERGSTWDWQRAVSLSNLGHCYFRFGDLVRGRSLLEEAASILRSVGDRLILGLSIAFLADVAFGERRLDEALGYARESIELHALTGILPEFGLEILVRVEAALGHLERAVQLAGFLSAQRPYGGTTARAVRSELVEQARDRLGADRAAAVWARGEAMTIAEAAAFGLGDSGDGSTFSPNRSGRPRLTERETQVLELIAHGQSNKQIAAALVVSTRTVERHIENLYAKIGASSRAGATAYALRQNPV